MTVAVVAGVKRVLTVALIVRRMISIGQRELAADCCFLAAGDSVDQRSAHEQAEDQREERCHDRRVGTKCGHDAPIAQAVGD
jgi:hypothetical protein